MKRYAVYYLPQPGPFAQAAACWLGYDVQSARDTAQPLITSLPRPLAELTVEPRKYGFHATLKAPFRLADGVQAADVMAAMRSVAEGLARVEMEGLRLASLDGFLAFVPDGDATDLNDLAACLVRSLDPYRAPLTEAEITRRRPDRLTPRQRDLLAIYGYPFVLEEYRCHLTLSGPLTQAELSTVADAAAAHFHGLVPRPFVLSDVCLMGEDAAGRFHLLGRYPLAR